MAQEKGKVFADLTEAERDSHLKFLLGRLMRAAESRSEEKFCSELEQVKLFLLTLGVSRREAKSIIKKFVGLLAGSLFISWPFAERLHKKFELKHV